jgi:hypothetical protein
LRRIKTDLSQFSSSRRIAIPVVFQHNFEISSTFAKIANVVRERKRKIAMVRDIFKFRLSAFAAFEVATKCILKLHSS